MEKKPKGIPPPQENETSFQRFERLVKKVVSAPKRKKELPQQPMVKN